MFKLERKEETNKIFLENLNIILVRLLKKSIFYFSLNIVLEFVLIELKETKNESENWRY